MIYSNGDTSIVNVFINNDTLSKCDDSSTIKDMDGDVEKGEVSSGYGSMNIHTVYKLNDLK